MANLLNSLEGISQRGKECLTARSPPTSLVGGSLTSWIDGTSYPVTSSNQSSDKVSFDYNGFIVKRSFVSQAECAKMLLRMESLAETHWHPNDSGQPSAVFRTDGDQIRAQGSSDYFLDSADRLHFFAEKDAVDASTGFVTIPPGQAKISALNKSGHGLHVCDDVFRSYSTSPSIASLVRSLGWRAPVIPQSMYIFKQPVVGGEVTSHQDSTFLYTTPRQSCLGLWLALHDATVANGCLWVRPGSHVEAVRRRFSRNQAHFEGDGDKEQPQMIFEELTGGIEGTPAPWEGKIPEGAWPPPCCGLFDKGFVPVECSAGDLVVFPGTLDHLSLPNCSQLPRHTFQLHLVEGPKAGVEWSKTNWLQYPSGNAFLEI